MNLDQVIEFCIRCFLDEYVAHPLRRFREIGLQTRLKTLIQEKLQTAMLEEYSQVQVGINNANEQPYATEDDTERTQLELRVQPIGVNGAEKTDIVVLRAAPQDNPITLTRYAMGHLDIVSKVLIGDVDAAIELKAACSSDKGQRHLFRRDIEKLLALTARTDGRLAAHFVLVDKSLPVREHNTCQVHPINVWDTENQADVATWTAKERSKFWDLTPRLVLTDCLPEKGPFVHVWDLVFPDDQNLLVTRHRYATRAAHP